MASPGNVVEGREQHGHHDGHHGHHRDCGRHGHGGEGRTSDFFDSQSTSWDDKPNHLAMADGAVKALLEEVHVDGNSSVLEFGCGTGICSAALAPKVGKVVGVDTSAGMVQAYNSKAEKLGIGSKMHALQLLLTSASDLGDSLPDGGFDLVFSHLTLHHVDDIEQALQTLASCVRPGGGTVAISDFKSTPHSKEFHPEGIHKHVSHHGICPNRLARAMEAAGLIDVRVLNPFTFDKPVESGGTKKFEFLLGVGRRK